MCCKTSTQVGNLLLNATRASMGLVKRLSNSLHTTKFLKVFGTNSKSMHCCLYRNLTNSLVSQIEANFLSTFLKKSLATPHSSFVAISIFQDLSHDSGIFASQPTTIVDITPTIMAPSAFLSQPLSLTGITPITEDSREVEISRFRLYGMEYMSLCVCSSDIEL